MLSDHVSNHVWSEPFWASITPGSRVAMSMIVGKVIDQSVDLTVVRCPETSCSGSWQKEKTDTWATWLVMHFIHLYHHFLTYSWQSGVQEGSAERCAQQATKTPAR